LSDFNINTIGKPESIVPVYDKERLEALYRYELLDTPPEEFFDRITRFASKLTKAPSAFISLVDADRVWYKSNFSSLEVASVERDDSLCSLTILNEDPVTVFEDTHKFDSLMTSPYVNAPGGIRFYAGAPLITHDGFNIGTVCVIDSNPRSITEDEANALKDLALLVVEHIELRAASRKAIRKHDELHSGLVEHVAPYLNEQQELLQEAEESPTRKYIINKAVQLGHQVQENLETALALSIQENEKVNINLQLAQVSEIAKEVVTTYEPLAEGKGQNLYFTVASRREFLVDSILLDEALKVLVGTAIKFTRKGNAIGVDIFESESYFRIEVSSESTMLTKHDLQKMFLKFAQLSAKTSTEENASGLELARVKSIIEAHDAKIWAETTLKDVGMKFVIAFKIN
jgi:signal transduction histidine kinase